MERDIGTPNTAYPLIGQVVGGRYHILELIGEGGMGVVYKAEQRLGSTLRKVAVKTLHAELSRDPSITARFHREVGTVAQLEHPNTVRVYDFGSTDDGTLYIAMEFLDGKPLNRVIETEGPLEPRRVAHLIRQVAGSLDEAHRQGIVHRDLKPENVLLIERAGEKDVVKLVDFGIAARTESADREKEQKLTQQGMVLGTPPYMSPEQFTGKHLDARSDVYSLGIMAYEMLTGQLPFQADTPWQWATHHMTSQPRSFDELPSGSQVPEALRRTVLKALAKDPRERQSSAGQFYAEFAAGVGNVGSQAPKAGVVAAPRTEAMPGGAPFAMAPTEGMQIPPAVAVPAMASPPVALPPAPPRERSAGGRGLIYGLSAAGAGLLVTMVVVALTSRRGEDPAAPLDLTASSSNAPAASGPLPTEEPVLEPDPPSSAAPDVEDSKPARPKPATPTKQTPTKPAAASPSQTGTMPSPAVSPPAPAAAPVQPTPAPSTPVTAQTPTPSPPIAQPVPAAPLEAGDACVACIKAAAKDIPGASQAYLKCTTPVGRKQCEAKVAQNAPKLAEYAANNQKCDEARRILAAAKLMGIQESPRMSKVRDACK